MPLHQMLKMSGGEPQRPEILRQVRIHNITEETERLKAQIALAKKIPVPAEASIKEYETIKARLDETKKSIEAKQNNLELMELAIPVIFGRAKHFQKAKMMNIELEDQRELYEQINAKFLLISPPVEAYQENQDSIKSLSDTLT